MLKIKKPLFALASHLSLSPNFLSTSNAISSSVVFKANSVSKNNFFQRKKLKHLTKSLVCAVKNNTKFPPARPCSASTKAFVVYIIKFNIYTKYNI